MDAVDGLVLDYLLQNVDRHIYYFEPVQYGSLFLLDHGKGLVCFIGQFVRTIGVLVC